MEVSVWQNCSSAARPWRLENEIQHYTWGGRGKEAFIPRLLGIDAPGEEPYAELWIGAHPKAPSVVVLDGARLPLDQLIAQFPKGILGERVAGLFDDQLPFLFKVLSAIEPLSIQVHPDKPQAELLHRRDPVHYPDANHKPEIAIALDSLTALAGFKPVEELADVIERKPDMGEFLGVDVTERLYAARCTSEQGRRDAVKALTTTLLQKSLRHSEQFESMVQAISLQLRRTVHLREEERLFLDLYRTHRGADVGLIFVFLLNLVHLKEGEGLYTPAGMPHAYIRGNIVECMANSDNVVRIGLTEKYKDVDAALDVLRFDSGPVSILEGKRTSRGIVYPTPAAEFGVSRLLLRTSEICELEQMGGPQVLLLLRGRVSVEWGHAGSSGEDAYRQGQSMLLPSAVDRVVLMAEQPAEVFRVMVPGW